MFIAKLKAFAYDSPTNKAPTKPGPYVGVIVSISSNFTFASSNAFFVTLDIASIWFLDAISGTTPPYFSCIGICVSIMFDKISLPFFTTDTDVSSQLDSIPNVSISFFFKLVPSKKIRGFLLWPSNPDFL